MISREKTSSKSFDAQSEMTSYDGKAKPEKEDSMINSFSSEMSTESEKSSQVHTVNSQLVKKRKKSIADKIVLHKKAGKRKPIDASHLYLSKAKHEKHNIKEVEGLLDIVENEGEAQHEEYSEESEVVESRDSNIRGVIKKALLHTIQGDARKESLLIKLLNVNKEDKKSTSTSREESNSVTQYESAKIVVPAPESSAKLDVKLSEGKTSMKYSNVSSDVSRFPEEIALSSDVPFTESQEGHSFEKASSIQAKEESRKVLLIAKLIKMELHIKKVEEQVERNATHRKSVYKQWENTMDRLFEAIRARCALKKKLEEQAMNKTIKAYELPRKELYEIKLNCVDATRKSYNYHNAMVDALNKLEEKQDAMLKPADRLNKTHLSNLHKMVKCENQNRVRTARNYTKGLKLTMQYLEAKSKKLAVHYNSSLKVIQDNFNDIIADIKGSGDSLLKDTIEQNKNCFMDTFCWYDAKLSLELGKILTISRLMNRCRMKENAMRKTRENVMKELNKLTTKYNCHLNNLWELKRAVIVGTQTRKYYSDVVKKEKKLLTEKNVMEIKRQLWETNSRSRKAECAQMKEAALMEYLKAKRSIFKDITFASRKAEELSMHVQYYNEVLKEQFNLDVTSKNTLTRFPRISHDIRHGVKIELGKRKPLTSVDIKNDYETVLREAASSQKIWLKRLQEHCLYDVDVGLAFNTLYNSPNYKPGLVAV